MRWVGITALPVGGAVTLEHAGEEPVGVLRVIPARKAERPGRRRHEDG
jgi:hypothetical protein